VLRPFLEAMPGLADPGYDGAGHGVLSSTALVPAGSKRLILDNDAHDPRRRRNGISHEMSHLDSHTSHADGMII